MDLNDKQIQEFINRKTNQSIEDVQPIYSKEEISVFVAGIQKGLIIFAEAMQMQLLMKNKQEANSKPE